jgi:hypothetical protein
MSTNPVRHERRAAQRFDYQLPISIKVIGSESEVHGCTQDLSARGAFFYTEAAAIAEGLELELTVHMPAQITLTESMHVRCKGKVLRVTRESGSGKIGVAVQLEGYEYLPDSTADNAEGSFGRIASLHEHVVAGEEHFTARQRSTR